MNDPFPTSVPTLIYAACHADLLANHIDGHSGELSRDGDDRSADSFAVKQLIFFAVAGQRNSQDTFPLPHRKCRPKRGRPMPDMNGVLSQTDKQKLIAFLSAKKQGLPDCPFCHSKNWQIADHVVSPSIVNAAGIGLGMYPYPQALIISECGHTFYLNLIAAGVIPQSIGSTK